MITKVTGQNSVKYQKLFREAEELLSNEAYNPSGYEDIILGETIGDLYSYFMAFPQILDAAGMKDASNENKTGDPMYYQKYFTILPLDEPVFEINADTRAITIPSQFKSIGVTGDNTAEIIFFSIDRFFDAVDFGAPEIRAVIEWHRTSGDNQDTYVDEAYIKELTLQENKVLIGWVIDERVTEEAAPIEFAVRLFMKDLDDKGNEIISYSFSTSAAKVNINKTLNFYTTTTEIDNTAIAQVRDRIRATHSPDVSSDSSLNAPIYTLNIDSNVGTYSYSTADNFYADLNDTGELEISVQARSTNGKADDKLLYRWLKWDELGKEWTGPQAMILGNSTTLDSIGQYKCVAIDNVGIRRSSKDSQILHILGPQKPKVKVADEGAYTSIILTDKADGMELNVKPGYENNMFYVDNYDINNKTKLSYEWKKSNNLNDTIKTDIEDAYEQKYQAKEEGYYYGYAVTQRNLKIETSDKASIYRVTKPLIKPISDYTILGLSNVAMHQGILGNTIIIDFRTYDENGEVSTTYAYDNIQYQWYHSAGYGADWFKVETADAAGTIVNGQITFKPTSIGEYKVNLLIKRNGEIIPAENVNEEDPLTWYTLEYKQTNGEPKELEFGIGLN